MGFRNYSPGLNRFLTRDSYNGALADMSLGTDPWNGDLEPESQRAILATGADLRADVLKVPHHGSSQQEPTFIAATQARLAIISAGLNNDYGHPAPRTIDLLNHRGMRIARTDTSGSIALQNPGDQLSLTTNKPRP